MGLLNKLLGRGEPAVTLGGVVLPSHLEPLHLLIAGATGTGKTTALDEMLSTIIPRGDQCIICDPDGHHVSRFYRENTDTILNPFDKRSAKWSVFNEVRKNYDHDRLARSIVPPAHGNDAQWHFYAQTLLSEITRALTLRGETTTDALMQWATCSTKEKLAELLVGTPAQGLFDTDAGRALASTRFILTSYLNPHKYMAHGDFSLRTWLEGGRGTLYLTWRADMQAALMPLVSCWADIICNAVLSLSAHSTRRIWLVLDELGSLNYLASLEAALTRGRKHGLCVVTGLQSTAQLDRIYGGDAAIVLRSCFRNLVVLGISKSDPDTADVLSRALGEREIEREQRGVSKGPGGITKGINLQRQTERLVLPSEIAELPDLHGYLALAGANPTALINLRPQSLPTVAPALVED